MRGRTPPTDAAAEPGEDAPYAARAAAGLFGGFLLLAGVDAIAIAVAVPLPAAGLPLRLAHHAFDAAETIGVGALLALALGVALSASRRVPRWVPWCLLLALHVALVEWVLGGYLRLAAMHVFSGRHDALLFAYSLAMAGVSLTTLPALGASLARYRLLRYAPVVGAVSLLLVAQIALRDDYDAIHGLTAWGAVLLSAPALAPLVVRAARRLRARRVGRVALAALGLFALFGLLFPPPNATRCQLFRQPCAIASWALASVAWRLPPTHEPVTPPPSPWLRDRTGAPPIAPTEPALLPRDAVVVLLTIDALRADVVADPANDARFPVLARLKREGVVFEHASASGNQTVLSLGAMFSGLQFSERRWEPYGDGRARFFFPANDVSPRFPELLSAHGVATVDLAGLFFFTNDFGVARGFRDEPVAREGRHVVHAAVMIPPLLRRLEEAGDEPLFVYTHLMEAHAPYGRPVPGATDHERYLSQVALADQQVGRVLEVLERRFGERWALFVSADHGEAFGDHETTFHSKTLYEELLHVPLLARSPRFPARRIDQRVGLVDLGPTLLDLFRVDTPATLEGESLAPLLAGRSVELTRPLLAEGRLRRALTRPDGLKVIEDPLRKTVEVYDLDVDPHETENLFDRAPARADAALAELRAFYAVHAVRGGYEAPYIP